MADTVADAPQTNGHPTPSPNTAPAASQPTASAPAATTALQPLPSAPSTSATDSGTAKRPRDARLIHMLLSSLGVTAYQDRVPLLLLDFAYRHTSSILSDALHLSSDAYISQQTRAKEAPTGAAAMKDVDEKVTMSAIHLAIQSRLQYQFQGGQSGGIAKEFLLEAAEQRNKVALPRVGGTDWGVRLPAEKFVLSGVPWSLTDEWEGDDEVEEDGDVAMGGVDKADATEEAVDGEGVEGGTANDLFGEDFEDEPMETEE